MKKHSKFLSVVLSLLMLLPSLVSCHEATPVPETTEAQAPESTEQTTALQTEAQTEYHPDIEKKNYDSEFYLFINPDNNPVDYHWVKESANDVMSEAVFDRQQKVFSYLGVELVGIQTEKSKNYVEPFKTAVKSKDGSVDGLLTHVYHGIDGFITGNFLSTFNDYDQINLDADYWNTEIMENASLNGKMYLGKSDYNILWTYVIAYNKDMLEKYGDTLDESIYDTVDNYRWTLDKMISLANLVYIDETGDGQTTDDTFGIIGCQDIAFCGFLQSCNVNVVDQNEKGEYVFSAYNSTNKAKTADIVDKIHNLAKSDSAWFWKRLSTETVSFETGKVLFSLADTKGRLPAYAQTDISFGVLPYPMYDENQRDVGYRSLQWGGYICIPSYVTNSEMVGDMLEMLSFYSQDVSSAFYEKLLGKQAADTLDDSRMLDIVWDGICTDFAQSYYSLILDTRALYLIPDLTYEDTTASIASFVAGIESTVNKKISKFFTTLEKKQ